MDQRTWLEAAENGWWYSAVLPERRLALAYMTDVDLLPPPPRDLDGFAMRELQRTALTLLRLPCDCQASGFRLVSATSYRMDRVIGRNWVAVGDAAMGWDPLSGQGISKALEGGLRAADALLAVRDGSPTSLEEYATWIADEFDDYRRAYARYYRAEARWPQSRFWQRRQGA
jgi:flavin-dependent dehydrogenase